MKKEKKHFEHEIEDNKSSLWQVDEAKKLNENASERSFTFLALSILNNLKLFTSNKKETPTKFIHDLPYKFPSFTDENN